MKRHKHEDVKVVGRGKSRLQCKHERYENIEMENMEGGRRRLLHLLRFGEEMDPIPRYSIFPESIVFSEFEVSRLRWDTLASEYK